jgi:SAM-dependent methyltransferase
MDDVRGLHRDNAAAWDETAAIYERDEAEHLALIRAGGSLKEPERRILGDLRAWCGRAVHLQCSAGLDALSLWRMGAREVVGVDISPRMIALARRKAEALGAPATFHRCDVLDAPRALDGTADLVYTGQGALLWMMDLDAWAAVVHRLLAPGGRVFVFEGHPLDWVWDVGASEFRLDPSRGGYFSRRPAGGEVWPRPYLEERDDLDPARLPLHDRQWTLGEVVTALAGTGLRLLRLEEHPEPFWGQFPHIPPGVLHQLPHTFSLLMRKE